MKPINMKQLASVTVKYKHIPEKPKDVSHLDDISGNFSIGICPACGVVVDTTENYCRKCGQKLDWEAVEKDERETKSDRQAL